MHFTGGAVIADVICSVSPNHRERVDGKIPREQYSKFK
jgi:hypothetical protein